MTAPTDELQAVRRVADAVLYEGYLLYPYRASSSKNQVRWQFGVVGPVGAAEAGVGEASTLHTECLLDDAGAATVDIHLRFLHTQWRSIERVESDGSFSPIGELQVGGARWIAWHEAVEQESHLLGLHPVDLRSGQSVDVTVSRAQETELLHDDAGAVVGRLVRTRWPLSARIDLTTTPVPGSERLCVLRVTVTNTAQWGPDDEQPRMATERDVAARRSLVGTHLVLRTVGGSFVSTVDPPAWAAEAARACTNSRCWPVLAGLHDPQGAQASDVVLAAPIILYDHPVIAEESPGELYDSTEIDEILTLRIMTMTDEEKLAARGTDPRAAAIIDRCDGMPPEVFERLHGALRGYDITQPADAAFDDMEIPTFSTPAPDRPNLVDTDSMSFDTSGAPWWDPAEDASVCPETDAVLVGDVRVAKGSRVLLKPNRRADAQDLFLAGMTATVRAVLADVDGGTHVAVTLDNDPASELHDWYGRYYYFAPDELESLPAADSSEVSAP